MLASFRRRVAEPQPAPADSSINVNEVSKTFDNGVQAVHRVSLNVGVGEFVALVGESGCGKSTLLRMVGGLIRPTHGVVEVSGSQIVGPRRDIGLMFQKPALLEWRTALENALIPVGVQRRITEDDIDEAMWLLDLFGLAGAAFRFPRQLSGGMQQRVALARLLMTHARVRLLDEPFAAVDELTREHLNVELLRIHERDASATLLVTHNISESVLLSDRVVVLGPRPGVVVADIPVTLPRPRTPDMVATPEFQKVAARVRGRLLDEAERMRR